jgi:hypothetical protein
MGPVEEVGTRKQELIMIVSKLKPLVKGWFWSLCISLSISLLAAAL